MRRFRSPPLSLILLLGLALLLTRVVGTHLHFCFDGREAPVAVHVADGDLHHAGHQGEDVKIDDASAAKSWQSFAATLVFIAAAVLLWLPAAPRPTLLRSPVAAPPRRKLPHVLRPPLRGPPLSASLA
ncbi:hypothetical protein D0B54_09220 [Solimonas sp. K1W22B-7]|uniref:hypothetical protein n=1 Tax=Solimonas sp. K1W22B-7 TaxID=2303331 RepID=UPI000E331690|nr:hypothetical protein [Solimonas sp. K1W22B-7]AXQ28851.1 hypothetical protein D0B54_09220 [Solimonas sp. K1W22B-7]